MKEKRGHLRYPVKILNPVQAAISINQNRWYNVHPLNISQSGIKLLGNLADYRIKINPTVKLKFLQISNNGKNQNIIGGIIKRHYTYHPPDIQLVETGVEFIKNSEQDTNAVNKLIEQIADK